MLLGDTVLLRAERRDDLPVLHAAFDLDPHVHALTSEDPWVPRTLEARVAAFDRRQSDDAGSASSPVRFAVQRRDDPRERCVGYATMWGLDLHNRVAHLGLGIVPDERGGGLGRQVVGLLCDYAFAHRDLHRVQLETLGANTAMQAVAVACGFTREGVRREVAFVGGTRDDEVVYGLLRSEWAARTAARRPAGGS